MNKANNARMKEEKKKLTTAKSITMKVEADPLGSLHRWSVYKYTDSMLYI